MRTHRFINRPRAVADDVNSIKHWNQRLTRHLLYHVPLLRHLRWMTDKISCTKTMHINGSQAFRTIEISRAAD